MIDPFTAFAAVKSAVSAGKELVNVTKQIGEFFDGVDDLRAAHEKKKNSVFSSSDENSMETFVNLQRAKDAEEEETAVAVNAVERNWIAKEHFMMLSSDRFMF